MKMNKIIIIIFAIVAILLIVYAISKGTKANVDNVNLYDKPIISLVTIGDSGVTIQAGIYAYGDINQDGVIDKKDIKFVELLLNSKLSFTDEQKELADLNHDGEVTQKDLQVLNDLLAGDKKIQYNTKPSTFKYGISDDDNSENCSWQDSNEFMITTEKEYFAFVKSEGKISNSYKFKYEKNEEEYE